LVKVLPRIVGADAHQLGRGVALDGERNIAWAAGIDAPTAVFVLVAHHLSERTLEPARIARFQERVQEDIVGLEHRVGFEFPAPITIRVLQGEQEVPRADDGRLNICQVRVQSPESGPPKTRRHGLRLPLLNTHAI